MARQSEPSVCHRPYARIRKMPFPAQCIGCAPATKRKTKSYSSEGSPKSSSLSDFPLGELTKEKVSGALPRVTLPRCRKAGKHGIVARAERELRPIHPRVFTARGISLQNGEC